MRKFIRVNADGVVNQVLEYDGPAADVTPAPDGMVELDGADAARPHRELILYAYDAQAKTFTPPPAPPVAAKTVEERLTDIEAALAALAAKP